MIPDFFFNGRADTNICLVPHISFFLCLKKTIWPHLLPSPMLSHTPCAQENQGIEIRRCISLYCSKYSLIILIESFCGRCPQILTSNVSPKFKSCEIDLKKKQKKNKTNLLPGGVAYPRRK